MADATELFTPDRQAGVSVLDLDKKYGNVHAVRQVSFDVPAGSICGFIGPNGAGKTTTMRMLATLELPEGGDAWIDGLSILEDPSAVRRRIGFMPDRFDPLPNLTVVQYLDFFARAQGLKGQERKRTVAAVSDFCGLAHFHSRPATGLSKGMGQRLHLAKTLLHRPAFLILDEPSAGLDPRARIEFRALIRALAAEGIAILISSHILTELSETCDTIVVIEKGKHCGLGSDRGRGRRNPEGTPPSSASCRTRSRGPRAVLADTTTDSMTSRRSSSASSSRSTATTNRPLICSPVRLGRAFESSSSSPIRRDSKTSS